MKNRRTAIKAWPLLCMLGSMVCSASGAQTDPGSTSELLLLNGNTGKPMPGVALFLSPVCDTPCVFSSSPLRATTDAAGKILLPEVANMRSVQVMSATKDFMYCQNSSEHNLRPITPDRFDWDNIRRLGVVAPNRCSAHLHVAAEPGKLIFFLRPLTWWESLSKPPSM